jgi:hypothetical protein
MTVKRSTLNNNALRELMASNKQKNENPNIYYEDLIDNPDAIHRVNINQITSYSQGSEIKEYVGITLEESRDLSRDEAVAFNNSMSIFRSAVNFIFGERQTSKTTQIVRVATTRDNFMPDPFELAGNNQTAKQRMIEYHTLAMIDETVLDGMQKIPERTPVKIMFLDNNKEMAYITSVAREQVEISQTTPLPAATSGPTAGLTPNRTAAVASVTGPAATDLAQEMLAFFGGELDIQNAYVSNGYQPQYLYTPCGIPLQADQLSLFAGKLLDYDYIPAGLPEKVKKALCFAMKTAGWTRTATNYGFDQKPEIVGDREIASGNKFREGGYLKEMFDVCSAKHPEPKPKYSTGGLGPSEPYCAAMVSWWLTRAVAETLGWSNYSNSLKGKHEFFEKFSPFGTMIKFTGSLVQWGKARGSFYERDQIIYNTAINPAGFIFHMPRLGSGSDSAKASASSGHTGLVIGYNRAKKFVLTVEGNTSFSNAAAGANKNGADWKDSNTGKGEGCVIKTRDPATLTGFTKWW